MKVVYQNAQTPRTPGRIALVEAVDALVDGDFDAADAAARRVRAAVDEGLGVEADTLDALIFRARGRLSEASERFQFASGRVLVEARILDEDRRRSRVA
jgi:hypothetical protein